MIDLSLGYIRTSASPAMEFLDPGIEYGQPQGSDPVRAAAAQWIGAAVNTVAITTGASVALAATLAILERPCSILCPRPFYPLYPRLAELFGIDLIYYDLRADLGWQSDPHELMRLLRDDTRAILCNYPGNPIGVLPEPDVFSALCDLVCSRKLLLISDEVYADFVYDGAALPDLDGISATSLVRIRSFSKLLGMPGERLGFVVADPKRLTAICRAHWTLALSPPAMAQAKALSRLGDGARDRLHRLRARLKANRDSMETILRGSGQVSVARTTGGIFLWIGPFDRVTDSVSLGQACRTEARVAVMPGAAFGVASPAYLRVSFAVPEDEAVRGAQALADFLGQSY